MSSSDENTNTDEGFAPIELIFAGRRGSPDKPMVVFYPVGESHEDDNAKVFSSPTILKMFKQAILGGVYACKVRETTFIFSTNVVRMIDQAQIALWRAQDQAFDIRVRAEKRIEADRAKGRDSLYEKMIPFRREYQKTDRLGRLALEVALLDALRRPLSPQINRDRS